MGLHRHERDERSRERRPAGPGTPGMPEQAARGIDRALELQRTAGNTAVARTIASDGRGTSVQRAIGDLGPSAVGRTLRRPGRPVAAYRITRARETAHGWEYFVEHDAGLVSAGWVQADTADYELGAEPEVSAQQQALQEKIDGLRTTPNGSLAQLLNGRPAAQVAASVGMGEMQSTGGPVEVLWSGGASDCVIVAAVGSGRGWITHADRTGPAPATIAREVKKIEGRRVHLASQMFGRNGSAASGLVRTIVEALEAEGLQISGILDTSTLAVATSSSLVAAGFTKDEVRELNRGSGWEAVADAGS